MLFGVFCFEVGRAIIYFDKSIMIGPLLLGIFLLTFLVCLKKLKSNHEIYITAFVTFIYAPVLIINYSGSIGYFNNVLDTFYFTYCFTFVEGLIASKIPYLSHKTFYRIAGTLLRFLIIPLNDKGFILMHGALLVTSIYFDYDRENRDKNLFESYIYSQEQLNRVKDLVVNDIPDGIVIVTSDLKKCLFANTSLISMFGDQLQSNFHQSFQQFSIHQTLTDLQNTTMNSDHESPRQYPDKPSKKTLFNILKSEAIFENRKISYNLVYFDETSSSLPEKEKRVFDTKILPLVWDKQSAIAIIFHDITQQNTILELKIAANIHKDRILATVSHELRTPLNGILGMVEIMESSTQDKTTLSHLSICKNSCHLLQGFVNSILDLNLIRANKIKLNPERIDFPSFLKEALQLFEFQCRQKGISLTQKIHPSMSKIIMTDKARLSQILINLIGNALKFTLQGGITIKAEERSIKGEEYVEIFVEDTGVGIKKEDQGKLFKMFEKVGHTDTVVNKHGVGLGLTISNDISKLLCKNDKIAGIKVSSRINFGSKFSFILNKNLLCNHHEKDKFTQLNLTSFGSCEEINPDESKMKIYPTKFIKKVQMNQPASCQNLQFKPTII